VRSVSAGLSSGNRRNRLPLLQLPRRRSRWCHPRSLVLASLFRLRPNYIKFESSFAPFAANSAHPSELRQHPDFKHGVALLSDSSIPLETVLQYALGGNWMLACVALAALAERKDAASAADQVLAHFDRMAVWCMHYALEFFLVADPRPATGAPAVLAKDWWRENPILPLIFRDYFRRRAALGDAATFGNALQSSFASSPALIRAFLEWTSGSGRASIAHSLRHSDVSGRTAGTKKY
jgi:hypothetical protein